MQTLLNTIPRPTGPETTTSTGAPTGVARFVGSGTSPSTLDATSIRINHALNSKLALFGRYNEVPSSSLSRNLSYLTGLSSTSRTLTVGATLSLNRRLTNELRVNYSSNRGRQNGAMDDFGGAVPIDQSVLLSGYTGPGAKYGEFLFNLPGAGVAVNLGDSVDSYQRQMNVVDSFSLVRGTHQFKFGFDYRRLSPVFGPRAFGQRVSVFSEAMILSGLVFLRRFSSQGSRPVFENFSAYLEDTWKLSRRLTLNLGLRWELNPPPHDANGRKPLLVQGVDNVPTATLAPADTPYYRTSYTAFAPRFGIAYQLRQRQGRETILRGGFGVYYDLNAGEAAAGFTGFPFSNAIAGASAVPFPIPPELVGPPPLPTVTPPITVTLYALKPDLRLPYALQWNVTLEQSLGATQTLSLAYVASLGRRLLTTQTLNWPLNGFGSPRSNPNFSDIQFTTNGPSSSYHSLQTQYRRRFSRGLQAMVNYTWSHAIDQVSNEVTGTTLERGNADFDVRHNLTAGVTYDIPKPSAGPVLSALFRGWSVDSTLYVQSGQPVNLSAGQLVRPDGTFFDVRPDVITGVPIWIKDPTKPGGRRINSAAFSLPPLLVSPFFRARQGTLGRNVVRSPGKYQVNMSLRRQFKLSEKSSLQLRAEVFNLLNHPLFGQYDTDVTSSRFGQALSTLNVSLGGLNQLYQLGGPRSLQFSARFSF